VDDAVAPMPRIRVLIAEDEPAVRAILSALIDGELDFVLVAAAEDAVEAIELADLHRPDVALVDVKMPGGGGPRATREILARSPDTQVIALSAFDDRDSVLDMLQAGAIGYLVKGTPSGAIVQAVHAAARGHGSLSMEVTAGVITELTDQLRRQEDLTRDQRSRMERIERVLESGVVTMAFQPIAELQSSRIVGVEALARFGVVPDRGPDAWFADAEMLGMRLELELTAVRSAIAQMDGIPDDAYLAVNVSPGTTMTPRFLDTLDGAPLHRVVMEITEHAGVDDYDGLNAALTALRDRGIRLAIDDAGAGFSSLRHIVRLSPDFIKLDITLTRDIDADPARRALATALISFASEIGATIIAEGIETRSEFETLRALGVAFGQGFYLARPAPIPAEGFSLNLSA
jgi:EAL domain-containing protein (putative c-di-GMP-specific phosphodiesterase class I)/CheY-like chemotaxis protein